MATIDELLKSLQTKTISNNKLENNKDTWSRIASKDSFNELNLPQSELDKFLSDWISENPYSAIA